MREYELTISDTLNKGLSPVDLLPMNAEFLDECIGFRCGIGALEPYAHLVNPFPIDIDFNYLWPFPQVVSGERYTFLINRIANTDEVYLVTGLTTLQYLNSIPVNASASNIISVADFGNYAVVTNGSGMLYLDIATNTWTVSGSLPTFPRMKTICNFRGQAVGGNIASSWYNCDSKYYVWSKIGSIDFTLDNSNEAGYRRCPYGGDVLCAKSLSNMVVGYSTKGIVSIKPVTDPAPTFGMAMISSIGLLNAGAVAGNDLKHVYLGADKRLYQITPGEGIKLLGYYNYMNRLEGDVVITYDSLKEDYYISDGATTFLLTAVGLTQVPQSPSAIWNYNGSTYILPDVTPGYYATIVTPQFNMGFNGFKTIFSIFTDLYFVHDPKIAIEYYLNVVDYGTTQMTPVNSQGIASVIASGNSFRINLIFNPLLGLSRVSYIKVRYKATDLRGVRGVFSSRKE